jgi:putative hydrolase of the HAD superfamily
MKFDLAEKYRTFIFDLDDTIYPEIEYLKSAYRFVAETVIRKEKNNEIKLENIYTFLIDVFKNEGRVGLYQKLCAEFNIKDFSVEEFLHCLRSVPLNKDELKVFPNIKILLELLIKRNKMLFVITNGNEIQQRNKVNSLNVSHSGFTEVIFSSSLGKEFEKPDPFFLNKIINDYSLKVNEIVFIGDSDVDKLASEQAGIDFMNVSLINIS